MSTPTTTRTDYDPVVVEIHRKALLNITNEMAITLMRTSGSPVVYEAKDFSTCLLDAEGSHLSFSSYAIFHTGSSLVGTKALVEALGDQKVNPGDGWLMNDPHSAGAMHQADIAIVTPVFGAGEHLGWAFSNMHVMDIGGVGVSGYAPGARNTFEECLRFPPTKVITNGAIDPEWEQFIAANVRIPGLVLNDIRSMIASNAVCQRKFEEVVDKYGVDEHRRYCEINKDLTEQVFRSRIAKLPDGVYRVEDWVEFDAFEESALLPMSAEMTIAGTEMSFALEGCAQVDGFMNGTKGAVIGQIMSTIMISLCYGDLPFNAGMWRPLTFDLGEPGTIVNSLPPAGVSNSHTEVGSRLCKMAKHLLNQALSLSDDPELRGRVAAQSLDAFQAAGLSGISQLGAPTVVFFLDSGIGCGGPAQTIGDGQDCYGMTISPGSGIQNIETHEAQQPILFLWRRLTENAGGPGRYRGGQSLDQAYTMYAGGDELVGSATNPCTYVPPRGAGGGFPGGTNTYFPIYNTNLEQVRTAGKLPLPETLTGDELAVPTKTVHLRMTEGDVFRMISGAGGGVGDPLLRPAQEVVADVTDGFVSAAHARAAYGVVLTSDGDTPGFDEDATARAREQLRIDRIGSAPTAALAEPASPGVSVVRDGGSFICGYCSHSLATADGDWRAGAVSTESVASEWMTNLDMYTRMRPSGPQVFVIERFCPHCAGVLDVDVRTEDTDLPRPVELAEAGER
ncbi:hydantoinase B/oxoprolinase family protein [Nocardia jiangxiensis]|uniref:hydantoinase B/oxoprolinase family protein n=1 Tax=Nocardia jiangxiensis TaxID=282685 RepID=UPI0002E75CE4|nr:hydantoinase B/oxoprolinase family protein [Nocardia jiangxiensis]